MSFSGQTKVHPKQCVQFLPPVSLLVIEQFTLAYEVLADPLLYHALSLIKIMAAFFTICPRVLERFPLAVPFIVELATTVVFVRPGHCASLELGFEVFNETLEEFLKSVRVSQVEPGCVRCAHGDGFHGCMLLFDFVREKGKFNPIGYNLPLAGCAGLEASLM
jgi:hypothetical protein